MSADASLTWRPSTGCRHGGRLQRQAPGAIARDQSRRCVVSLSSETPSTPGEHPGAQILSGSRGKAGSHPSTTSPPRTQDELNGCFRCHDRNPLQAISLFGDGFAIQNRQRIIDFWHELIARQSYPGGQYLLKAARSALTGRVLRICTWRLCALCRSHPERAQSRRNSQSSSRRHSSSCLNLKTAKALGHTIPPYAARACRRRDRVKRRRAAGRSWGYS